MFSVIFPVVAGSVSAWLDKSVCSRCDSKFTLNKPCAVCKKPVCGGCGIDFGSMTYQGVRVHPAGRCCEIHESKFRERSDAAVAKIDHDLERQAAEAKLKDLSAAQIHRVVVYSRNFKGHMEPTRLGKTIETSYFDDLDAAREEIKILAVLEDCYVVQQEHVQRKTENAPYTHSVFSVSGVI